MPTILAGRGGGGEEGRSCETSIGSTVVSLTSIPLEELAEELVETADRTGFSGLRTVRTLKGGVSCSVEKKMVRSERKIGGNQIGG